MSLNVFSVMKNFEPIEMSESMGGNLGFQFSPHHLIAAIPQAVEGIVTSEITMVSGAVFLDGYSSPGTLSYSETVEETRAGLTLKISVKGFYPKASAAMVMLFYEMTRQKHVLIVSGFSGEKIIFGNKKEPVSFVFVNSSKNVPGERSGYEFIFEGVVTSASPSYMP